MKKRLVGTLVLLVVVSIVIAEITARWYLGLGDPPLTVSDPEIEYMFATSRCYNRFGNRVCYNNWSMRSEDFPARKANLRECRILVLGDSIINGGSLTDQSHLATELVRARVATALHVPVVVGNVSAGSWGPGNLFAYVRKYGWFDADLAVFVFNSGDLHDVPTFQKDLGPDFPIETPVLALQEAIVRYLPRYFPLLGSVEQLPPVEADPHGVGPGMLRELLEDVSRSVPNVVVLLHPTPEEFAHGFNATADEIDAIATDAGIRVVRMDADLADYGDKAYRDSTHINDVGQNVYARRITTIALDLLQPRANASLPPTSCQR